ncbi:MAG: hypothetical protein PUD93_03905 [Lachnospiraceae bacterium]|nr:hypothetical protein [Lachnospiraceae bacterium]
MMLFSETQYRLNYREEYMQLLDNNKILTFLFGEGKGSGAALTLFILGIMGSVYCLIMGTKMKRYKYHDN